MMTDELVAYKVVSQIEDSSHQTINHSKGEYVRGEVRTN
jgi:hypothetical protein